MKVAALILGIGGGVVGFAGAVFALAVGSVGAVLPGVSGLGVVGLSIVAMGAGLLGIIGGALAVSLPRTAGILMLISAAVGLLATFAAYLAGALLLVVAGILALAAASQEAAPPPTATGGYPGTPGVQH